jgi:hypothetical protein
MQGHRQAADVRRNPQQTLALAAVLRLALNRGRCRGALAAAAAVSLCLVSACSWIPFVGSKSEAPPAAPACPVTAVLKPVANTVAFAPGADRKPIYVAWYGLFSDISSSCTLTGATLHAALDNVIVAERGPAARDNDVNLNYFVALTGPDQAILGKKTFSVHLTVPPAEKRAAVNDHVEVAFNTGGRPIADLTIMVGMQSPPEIVDFYKHYPSR